MVVTMSRNNPDKKPMKIPLRFTLSCFAISLGALCHAAIDVPGMTESVTPPTVDDSIAVYYSSEATSSIGARNFVEKSGFDKDRLLGQSFTITEDVTVGAITIQMAGNGNNNWEPLAVDGVHGRLVVTVSEVKVDGALLSRRVFDLAGQSLSETDSYLTMEFDAPVSLSLASSAVYSVQFAWDEDSSTNDGDHDSYNFVVRRNQSGAYAGGSNFTQLDNSETYDFVNDYAPKTASPDNTNDMNFYIHKADAQPTPKWAGYVIDENGDVDTGAFMGWLNVDHAADNWIWSYDLGIWVYLKESDVAQDGAWAYATMP
jgi:hypothetical protein